MGRRRKNKEGDGVIRRKLGMITTISIPQDIKDELDLLKINRKIPKYNGDNEIIYGKYNYGDLVFDLIYIYKAMVDGIKNDPELLSQYGYKTFKPYYVVKFLAKMGIKPEKIEGLEDLEIDHDELEALTGGETA